MSIIPAYLQQLSNLPPNLKIVFMLDCGYCVDSEKTEAVETCEEAGRVYCSIFPIDPFDTFGIPSFQNIFCFLLFLVVLVYLILQVRFLFAIEL